jgi:pectin methylesterase-like acyl-CoA thioesterase
LAIDNSQRANFIETFNVDDDGMASATDCDAADAAFTTIQSAINNGTTLPGDLIRVCPGTYVEDVNITKAGLRVIGSGAASTTISGAIGGDGGTVRISASNVTVAHFTLTRQGITQD